MLPERTEELDKALDRLRKNFYQLHQPIRELRSAPRPDELLQSWRRAPAGSLESRLARFYERAIDVLSVALDLPRDEAEALVHNHLSSTDGDE